MSVHPGRNPIRADKGDEETIFSGAATEMIAQAPSYVLRGPIYLIFIILFAALIYSILVEVDVRTTGRITLMGEEYVVQSPVNGIVTEIMIEEGERVYTGSSILMAESQETTRQVDQLFELIDEKDRLEKELLLLDVYEQYIDRIIRGDVMPANINIDLPANMNPTLTEIEDLKTRIRSAWLSMQMLEDDRQVKQQNFELAKENYESDKILKEKELITTPQFLASQTNYENNKKALEMAQKRIKEKVVALEREVLADQSQTKRQLENIQLQIKQAYDILSETDVVGNYCSIYSQYSGIVTQIGVSQGQRVGVGTPLAYVVRDNNPLIGKMYIANRDIGGIRVGQTVKIKYDAYPYQEYGVYTGRIIQLSSDVREVPGFGYAYEAEVSLNSYFIKKGNQKVSLRLGMQGLAEVVTGKKKAIELVFAPASKFFKND